MLIPEAERRTFDVATLTTEESRILDKESAKTIIEASRNVPRSSVDMPRAQIFLTTTGGRPRRRLAASNTVSSHALYARHAALIVGCGGISSPKTERWVVRTAER